MPCQARLAHLCGKGVYDTLGTLVSVLHLQDSAVKLAIMNLQPFKIKGTKTTGLGKDHALG